MVLGHKDDVAGGTSLLGLALVSLQELLAHHARRDVLVHIKAILVVEYLQESTAMRVTPLTGRST